MQYDKRQIAQKLVRWERFMNEFRLPRAFRFFEKGLTNSHAKSSDVLSMVIFEPEFLRELIDLGERDTTARGDEIEAFLRGEACAVPVW